MGSLKSLALLALLFSLSLAVIADTSNDATHAKDEVKPSEATDAIEPQKRGRGGCRYGCCGAFAFGGCSACCSQPQVVEAEANNQPQAGETEAEANDVVVEPQQWWPGFCRFGCCGGWFFGRCNFCCLQPQKVESLEAEAIEANAVEPQQRWGGGGGCRHGCCGVWRNGHCSYCCRRPQDETNKVVEAIEPQQGWGGGGGCRYGCCGGWSYGRCNYCCSRSQAKTDVVEPQQRGGCRYGCCGSYAYGQCSACCAKKMTTEEEKEEEAKP